MIIRKMAVKDADEVTRLEKLIFAEPWSKESFLEGISSDSDIYLVAENEEGILGYCGMWCVAGEGQITNVAVKPEERRKGIAEKMLIELMALAPEKSVTSFTLEARVSNYGAIHLYHKLGFHDVGIRPNFYAQPREDAVIMWL